jgi:hypothetical protein
MKTDHAAKPVQGDDEDYVDYLNRCATYWKETPPPAPDGFTYAECDATRKHWPWLTIKDTDFYDTVCPSCQYDALAEQHRTCEHSHHGRWRRWRVAYWIADRLYTSGLASTGGGYKWGDGCEGCMNRLPQFRGRRVYLLGRMRSYYRDAA